MAVYDQGLTFVANNNPITLSMACNDQVVVSMAIYDRGLTSYTDVFLPRNDEFLRPTGSSE